MSLRRMMLAGLKGGVYKNVALASNGGSVVLNRGVTYGGTTVAPLINGIRVGSSAYYLREIFAPDGDYKFTLDFGAVKTISELNFCHGRDDTDYGVVGENTPNNNFVDVNGIDPYIIIKYSTDGSTWTTLSSSAYSVDYLFSQNILATSFNARYISFEPTLTNIASYISHIEAWGLN